MKKAILIGIDYFKKGMLDYYMDELDNLADSLHINVVKRFKQKSDATTSSHKIGKGKLDEVKDYVTLYDIDYVIFNEELTNTQLRNLEDVFDKAVIDRTLLILEIFAKKAKTKEAMLQVEIAQLKYLKPRLSAMRNSFEQQQGGIGQKGPGEKKLELDRRKIEKEISTLERQLKNIVTVRQTNRKQRREGHIKNVAIVGYTNAGKSTLLNTLLEYDQSENPQTTLTKDQVFSTLETTTRRIQLKDKRPFTITDTIGFIANLPHDLVESFKSTLEEIREADLIVHVIDFSHPYYLDQIHTTDKVLKELGADEIETLYVFNKSDLTSDIIPHNLNPSVKVSLKEGTNVKGLVDMIPKLLFKHDTTVVYKIPHSEGDIINLLNEASEIITTDYENDSVKIKARVDTHIKGRLKNYEV